MGSGSFDTASYRSYASSTAHQSRDERFQSTSTHSDLNPRKLTNGVRESRDGDDHPNSTPIIVGLDVTGSMGMIAEEIAKEGLGRLVNGILETQPVSDPQLLFAGIGDTACDRSPFQVTQFESDNRMVNQLTKLYLEGGGGGNDTESYDLAWYFAAMHTVSDSFTKRNQKGYVFTIGDELFPRGLSVEEVRSLFGTGESGMSATASLAAASEKYNVFHLMVEQGHYFRRAGPVADDRSHRVVASWREHMGKRAILVDDYTKIPEVITAVIRVNEGEDPETVLSEYSGSTKDTVYRALFS